MTTPVLRVRMFAGPNGSGKSTMKEVLPSEWLGVYINADEMEKSIAVSGLIDLADYGVAAGPGELRAFLHSSSLLQKAELLPAVDQLEIVDGKVFFKAVKVNSYWASVLGDFIRHKLLAARTSFTFETVMSYPDKVDFLHKAQLAGYRTYLYFVATADPDINVARVKYRHDTGGHYVDEKSIRSRYVRSLELLPQAVSFADRAYIFDNSGASRVWIAEVSDGVEIEMKTDEMPAWFKSALWDKFEDTP